MMVPSVKRFGLRRVFAFPPTHYQEMSIKTESQPTELNPGCLITETVPSRF